MTGIAELHLATNRPRRRRIRAGYARPGRANRLRARRCGGTQSVSREVVRSPPLGERRLAGLVRPARAGRRRQPPSGSASRPCARRRHRGAGAPGLRGRSMAVARSPMPAPPTLAASRNRWRAAAHVARRPGRRRSPCSSSPACLACRRSRLPRRGGRYIAAVNRGGDKPALLVQRRSSHARDPRDARRGRGACRPQPRIVVHRRRQDTEARWGSSISRRHPSCRNPHRCRHGCRRDVRRLGRGRPAARRPAAPTGPVVYSGKLDQRIARGSRRPRRGCSRHRLRARKLAASKPFLDSRRTPEPLTAATASFRSRD